MANVCFVCLLLGLLVGLLAATGLRDHVWMGDAIEHRCASYDQVSGEFKWNHKK